MFDYFGYASMNERYEERLHKAAKERWFRRLRASRSEEPKRKGEISRALALIQIALTMSGVRPF